MFNAKNKIYTAVLAWLVLAASMGGYFFKILDSSNQTALNNISNLKRDLGQLESEQDSFNKSKQDLQALAKKSPQPEGFFSKDETLVKKIETLEDIARQAGIEFKISGLSGTIKTVPKAKIVSSNLASVPYSITAIGEFPKVVAFIDMMEHLDFVTNVSTVGVRAAEKGEVNTTLTASFYLRKQ